MTMSKCHKCHVEMEQASSTGHNCSTLKVYHDKEKCVIIKHGDRTLIIKHLDTDKPQVINLSGFNNIEISK